MALDIVLMKGAAAIQQGFNVPFDGGNIGAVHLSPSCGEANRFFVGQFCPLKPEAMILKTIELGPTKGTTFIPF